ncbi:MAG: ABC transporter substrate-binding protein, partial [Desulfurococcaceae archaeon]
EPLFIADERGEIVPWLAESYNVSSDGRVYTIKLKKGIKFHDGTPFNASAVKFTLERILDPNVRVPGRANYLVIDRVDVIDEHTVAVTLKHPFGPFISVLTGAYIISPKSAQELGDKISQEPKGIGTGPYKFQEWVRGEKIVLVKNSEYWRGTPNFDTLIFEVIPDPQTRLAKLLSNELDLIMQPPAADIQSLENNPQVSVLKTLSTRIVYIGINTQYGPLQDVRVRQAINYAVDKEAIVKNVLFNLGKVMSSPVPDNVMSYVKLGPYEYNPEKAKRLLADAGYPNGFKITLQTPIGRYLFDKEIADAVAQYLRQVGVDVELKTIADWPTYVSSLFKPLNETTLQLYVLGWAVSTPDPHFYLYQRFHSQFIAPNGFNTHFYKNDLVDRLLEEGMSTADPAIRENIYKQLNAILWEEAPVIYLHIQYFIIVSSKDLKNVVLYPYEMIDLTFAEWTGK